VTVGDGDLEGAVQIRSGLHGGESVVVHARRALTAGSRIRIVESILEAAP
jgi:hypothetical protein